MSFSHSKIGEKNMEYKLSHFNIPIKKTSDGVYYYNTLSKALLFLSYEIESKLVAGEISKIPSDLQDKLLQNKKPPFVSKVVLN